MVLRQINLENFRNFNKVSFNLSNSFTIIIGNNSHGKTNLLESIYFLNNGVGFREEREEELINLKKDFLLISSIFDNNSDSNSFSIRVEKKNNKTIKFFYVNKTIKKHNQYQKELPGVVLFTPEQINIISGSPNERRKYFNTLLSGKDINYKKYLNNYEVALRKRNKILEKYRDINTLIEELNFWNEYLEKQATYITKLRQSYIDFLNNNQSLDSKRFSIEYVKNEFNKVNLNKVFEKEKLIRKTVIGPQKDDFKITIENKDDKKDVHLYGSRSEERLAIFWLKINELKHFELDNKRPILLLDDIFSELDQYNQKIIFPLIKKYQTIATTTEEDIARSIKFEKKIIRL